jgi:Fe/S biogenesis protein NfuA
MPELTITDGAREQIIDALQKSASKTALRLEASTNGTAEFVYGMRVVGDDDLRNDDVVLDTEGGIRVFMDPASSQHLQGATVDYEEGILKSGFRFENPNQPEIPRIGDGPREDLTGPVAEKVEQLINTEINSAVAAHGGTVNFVGVKENKVYLSFGGGCHGCGMVDVTLKHGIEARIKELVPEIEEIVDTTDHSTGENPFYN